MSNKLTGILILYIMLSLLAGIAQQQYLSGTQVGYLQSLMTLPHFTNSIDIIGNVAGFITWGVNWLSALWNMITWNYPFLSGNLIIFRYIGWCFSIALVFIIGINMARGTSLS